MKSKEVKKALLEAYRKSLGNITSSCMAVGIDRGTFYKWKAKDAKFAKKIEELNEVQMDFVESKLLENIKNLDTSAIIFYLKTKGKHRGYIERTEITGKDGESLIPHKPMNLKEAKEFLAKIESEI